MRGAVVEGRVLGRSFFRSVLRPTVVAARPRIGRARAGVARTCPAAPVRRHSDVHCGQRVQRRSVMRGVDTLSCPSSARALPAATKACLKKVPAGRKIAVSRLLACLPIALRQRTAVRDTRGTSAHRCASVGAGVAPQEGPRSSRLAQDCCRSRRREDCSHSAPTHRKQLCPGRVEHCAAHTTLAVERGDRERLTARIAMRCDAEHTGN